MVTESMVPFTTQEDAWRRALKRAAARPYSVEYVATWKDARGVPIRFFRVNSNSQHGEFYSLSVARVSSGWTITCDCPAGQNNRVCAHAAVVLLEAGILEPDPDDAGVLLPAA